MKPPHRIISVVILTLILPSHNTELVLDFYQRRWQYPVVSDCAHMKRKPLMSSLKELLAIKARFNELPEDKIAAAVVDYPALKAIVSEIRSGKKPSVRIQDCTEQNVADILELDVSMVHSLPSMWKLPADVKPCSPSSWLKTASRMMGPWKQNSENTTRTRIDQILLDVLHHTPLPKLSCWGEVLLKWDGGKKSLTGSADYVLGYGGRSQCEYMESILVCGEAKRSGAAWNIWQIVAYCGVVHKSRIAQGKQNTTVYGFLTDSSFWEFIRIDNNSQVWTAKVAGEGDAMTWLAYILDCAQKSTPSDTPTASLEDMTRELENFAVVVGRIETGDENLEEDDEEEDSLLTKFGRFEIR
ncbi:hypothetical protein BDK51DRAFT_28303 [Blyttiomyces helicus]|uniref:Fungal-type protein kinase domain-containing protein n=1 Tax=Blyttiomyces helicus TaxID=388810 RepID=A0A4P9WGH8_9FUNG|nr:hypothetical protein BDK51DRAFT_28303 [Blyttiomyces helicus]|eukprot:RKO91015.1 hypothetical protein BDK51DRAFT_28303 [Blyttiomyces helicus]